MEPLTDLLKRIDTSELSNHLATLFDDVLELSIHPDHSLQEPCEWVSDNFGVHLTKQSLDKRYNTFAVVFMRSCFERLLTAWKTKYKVKVAEQSRGFGRILL